MHADSIDPQDLINFIKGFQSKLNFLLLLNHCTDDLLCRKFRYGRGNMCKDTLWEGYQRNYFGVEGTAKGKNNLRQLKLIKDIVYRSYICTHDRLNVNAL